MLPIQEPILCLIGPTAIGKTELSLTLAQNYNCEIISLDSMQVYRFMDIGTAKASPEERLQVPHYLLDMVDPDEHYDASRYVTDALQAINVILEKGKQPLITGGTGLYLRALLEGLFEIEPAGDEQLRQELCRKVSEQGSETLYDELRQADPETAEKIHKNDTHRLVRALEIYHLTGKKWSSHIREHHKIKNEGGRFGRFCTIGLTTDRDRLYTRINKRTSKMLKSGLAEEVEGLLARGYNRELKSMQSIGYRHMVEHLLDKVSLTETERLLARDTRRYAKRQYTWFKKTEVIWIDVEKNAEVFRVIDGFLDGKV